jgi:hypothetical protein
VATAATRKMSATPINTLLNDKLFQVIGSTPASIAESLIKADLSGKTTEGHQLFAVAIFASAVNKATLETFLADARFANVRPLISANLSIQGRSNMTALTLLGHCLMTTDLASSVTFASEFRKKMGQDHIWGGDLAKGSLSDKQKAILLEKKRVTDEVQARALGSGFLKWTGLDKAVMTEAESKLFKIPFQSTNAKAKTTRQADSSTAAASGSTPRPRRVSPQIEPEKMITVRLSETDEVQIPEVVYLYRSKAIGQSDGDIIDSISRRGKDGFVSATRIMMAKDPDGSKTRSASVVG